MQLSETVNSLLDLKVIPIFNENDAISTRRAPYEVYSLNRMLNLELSPRESAQIYDVHKCLN